MQLGKASAYGVLAVVHIARQSGHGPVQGRAIAESHGIPPEYLLKILQQLVRAGVLRSETGRRGGFNLKRSAQETTLLEIVEAIEGPLLGGLAIHHDTGDLGATMDRVEAMCRELARQARDRLGEMSVRDLLGSSVAISTSGPE
jgi:Rrf2 family protein